MDVLDLFCGVGGFSLGFEKAGFRVKYAIDKWNLIKDTFELNHPNTELIIADIQELDPYDFRGQVDIIIGSPPCQQFSYQNNTPDIDKGMILIKEYLKWIKIINPKFWILENVPSTIKWIKLKIKNIRIPRIKLLNCADYGIPQNRIRMFAGKFKTPIPTHSRYNNINLYGESIKKWVPIKEALKEVKNVRFATMKPRDNHFNSEQRKFKWTDTKLTCTGNSSGNGQHPDGRFFTLEEMKRFQTFPDDFEFVGSFSSIYQMIGNAVPPLMAYRLAKTIKNAIKKPILVPLNEFIFYLNSFFQKHNLPLEVVQKEGKNE